MLVVLVVVEMEVLVIVFDEREDATTKEGMRWSKDFLCHVY